MLFKGFKYHLRNKDVQNIINHLLQLKNQDSGWIVNTRMDPYDNRLTGLFWISPIQ